MLRKILRVEDMGDKSIKYWMGLLKGINYFEGKSKMWFEG